MAERNEILAQCPHCGKSLRVTVGRKSTVRTVTHACGHRYDYSAWVLRRPRTDEPVGLRTFYQVDFVEVDRA